MCLTQSQINKLREKVENNMSTDIKLSKAQKIIKKRRCSRINASYIFIKINKTSYFIRKKNISSFRIKCSNECYICFNSKNKIHVYGTKTIKFSNDDLNDMTKIVKALEDSDVLTKGVTKTLKNDIKKGVRCL